MEAVGLLVTLESRRGKEADAEAFLKSAEQLARNEKGTLKWYAIKIGPGKFGIFDTFENEGGRNAHLAGEIAKALSTRANELFANPPQVERVEVLASTPLKDTCQVHNRKRLTKSSEANIISAAFPYQKQRRRVLGSEMAYIEVGEGDPIVLLHGNPTSSYLWRNVLPYLQPLGRCIAPDLIGMGDSDKLPNSGPVSYRFVEHRRYLEALLEALDVRERVTFVVHDWGSALGFDWANRHREAMKGIAFMEAIVAPQGRDHWDKMGMRQALEALRSEAGEEMVLQNNYFIEEILPNAILRNLSDEEMAEYRRPFAESGEGRRPTLTWPRQIPIDGEPADVNAIATEYAGWLGTSNVPKLFLKAEPGAILANDTLVNLVRGWPALTEKTVAGIHFVQEDSPDEIGQAIVSWMLELQKGNYEHGRIRTSN